MKTIQAILSSLQQGQFEFSRHALHRAVERNISDTEIIEVAHTGRVIEEYPDDKYAPSCLILGFTVHGRPIHIHVSCADTLMVRIFTLYELNPSEWADYTRRK